MPIYPEPVSIHNPSPRIGRRRPYDLPPVAIPRGPSDDSGGAGIVGGDPIGSPRFDGPAQSPPADLPGGRTPVPPEGTFPPIETGAHPRHRRLLPVREKREHRFLTPTTKRPIPPNPTKDIPLIDTNAYIAQGTQTSSPVTTDETAKSSFDPKTLIPYVAIGALLFFFLKR